ncbi:MAG TPA: AMED_5909 family protein [Pseudonocardiaceae bacterium]|nr:AMED_5909 family protein [Pseudonocardiaceae bacterium]
MSREVLTLTQATEQLRRQWPGMRASVAARQAHYRRAAEVYGRVAEIDYDHYHEALYLASEARQLADGLTDESNTTTDGGESDAQE